MKRIGMLFCAVVLFSATCEVAGSVVKTAKKKRALIRLGVKMELSADAIAGLVSNKETRSLILTNDQKRADEVNARLQRKLAKRKLAKRKRVEAAVAAALAARENNGN